MAIVDEVGYEGLQVSRVAELAGVSRSALYDYFPDLQACFLATFETLMSQGLLTVKEAYADADGGDWDERLRRALDAMFGLLIAQPAAARLCFLEAYAQGRSGAALRERGAAEVVALVRDGLAQSPERRDMPPEVINAMVGGFRTIIQTRLRRRTESQLLDLAPALRTWVTSYRTPKEPLRRIRVRPAGGPRFVARSHQERLYVALAQSVNERGYTDAVISDVVSRASMSLSTFYTTFQSKEETFLAACDFGVEQAFAAARFAYEQETDWPRQVHAGLQELFTILASEPEWTYMAMIEILGAGPRARARRDRTIELFVAQLEAAAPAEAALDPVAIEAIGGAVYSLMYDQICNRGAARLPEILPASVFMSLAPFIGSDEAAAMANEVIPRRTPLCRANDEPRQASSEPISRSG